MDEVEISKAARPLGFIKFAAMTQGTEKSAKLVAFLNDEVAPAGSAAVTSA